MSTIPLPAPPSPVPDPIGPVLGTWFPDPEAPLALALGAWLRELDVPSPCDEAFAGYAHARSRDEEELVRPDGGVARQAPPQPSLSRRDFEHPRFAYIVAAWYDDMATRLARPLADWEAWQGGGFQLVVRDDDDEVACWTARDVRSTYSTWSLQMRPSTKSRGRPSSSPFTCPRPPMAAGVPWARDRWRR
jgi:hypothetical protein